MFLLLVVHFGSYLVNHGSNEDEIAQEYRETVLLSKYSFTANFFCLSVLSVNKVLRYIDSFGSF